MICYIRHFIFVDRQSENTAGKYTKKRKYAISLNLQLYTYISYKLKVLILFLYKNASSSRLQY